jgi:hypothetical protein
MLHKKGMKTKTKIMTIYVASALLFFCGEHHLLNSRLSPEDKSPENIHKIATIFEQ